MKQFAVVYKSALDNSWKVDRVYAERRLAEMRAELETTPTQKHQVIEVEFPDEEKTA